MGEKFRRQNTDASFVEMEWEREPVGSHYLSIAVGDRHNNVIITCTTFIGLDSATQLRDWLNGLLRDPVKDYDTNCAYCRANTLHYAHRLSYPE